MAQDQNETWENVPIYDPREIIPSIFPEARVTSTSRTINDVLSRRNPKSPHINNPNAFDVAPIPGVTYEEFIKRLQDAGYSIENPLDEQKHPSSWATGPHWHGVITGGPDWERVGDAVASVNPTPAQTPVQIPDPLVERLNIEQTPEYIQQMREGSQAAGSTLGEAPEGGFFERVGNALATPGLPEEVTTTDPIGLLKGISGLLSVINAGTEAIRGTPLEGAALASPLGGAETGGVAALGRIPKGRIYTPAEQDQIRAMIADTSKTIDDINAYTDSIQGPRIEPTTVIANREYLRKGGKEVGPVVQPANDVSEGAPRNTDQQPTFKTAGNDNPNELGFDNGVVEQPKSYQPKTQAPEETPVPHNRDDLDIPDLPREMPQVLDNPDGGGRTKRIPNPDEIFGKESPVSSQQAPAVDYDRLANEAQKTGDPNADLYWQSKVIADSGNHHAFSMDALENVMDDLDDAIKADPNNQLLQGIMDNLEETWTQKRAAQSLEAETPKYPEAANKDTRIPADKITSDPLEQDLINKADIAHDLGFNDERSFADRRTKAYKEWDAEVTRAEEVRDAAAKKFYESMSDEDLRTRVQSAKKFGNRDRIAEEVLLNRIPDETLHFEDSRKTPESANDNQAPFDHSGASGGEPPNGRTDDPVDRLTAYLQRATRVREDQTKLYTDARKERVAKMLDARKGTEGEEGFHAEKAALGGELPKANFDPVRDNFTQDDLTELFNRVRDSSKVSPFESIRAREGLQKLLDGTLPQQSEISLLQRVFGEDFTKAALRHRSGKDKFLSGLGSALNLPRALMSTADFSAPLRQGVFLIGRPEYWKALPGMYKYAFSQRAYEGMMDALRQHPNYDLLTSEGKLSLTDMGGNLSSSEEAFASAWAEKLPVYGHIVKGSDRAYSGFLNKLRFDVANSLLEDFRKVGIEPNAKQVRDIGRFVNNATGRGELGKIEGAAPMLNTVLYSPRLIASRVNLLNPVQYAKLDPIVRREAIKSAVSFGAIASTVLAIAKMNGAEIETDPRSTDFGKIRDGHTRYDIFGGFQQYARLATQLATNERKTLKGKVQEMDSGKFGQMTAWDDTTAFVRSKLNPIVSYMVNARVGTNPAGEKFEFGKDTLQLILPLVTQDLKDAYNDGGWGNVAKAIGPAIHGVSVQTFDPSKPRSSKTSSTTSTPATVREWKDEPSNSTKTEKWERVQ